MLFVQEDIFAKLIGSEKVPSEGLYVELNLKGQKWLINCSEKHLKVLSKNLDLQSSKHERFVFIGDLKSNDLILTNCPKYFQNATAIVIVLSNFQKL